MIPLLFEGKAEGWQALAEDSRLSQLFYDYLASLDFPQAFPWHRQKPRWQRAMLIISGIYRTHELVAKAASGARSCPFAGRD